MSDETTGLSVDEQDKIAAYHKAAADRQSGALRVAEAVPADAGMAASGEMPSGVMEPDRPTGPALAGLAAGAMPRPPMNPGAEDASQTPKGEMPRPPMN
jgi:hypothetical protein